MLLKPKIKFHKKMKTKFFFLGKKIAKIFQTFLEKNYLLKKKKIFSNDADELSNC